MNYGLRRGAIAALLVVIVLGLAGLDRTGWLVKAPPQDVKQYHDRTFLVARAIDGDTINIQASDGRSATTTIRLWGVDTPETKDPNRPVQHFGPQAAEFTRSLTQGRSVRLELVPVRTRDKYDRLLAYVYLDDGRLLNLLLVQEGCGYADSRFEHPYKGQFRAAEREAMRRKIGLWHALPPQELPEWHWSNR